MEDKGYEIFEKAVEMRRAIYQQVAEIFYEEKEKVAEVWQLAYWLIPAQDVHFFDTRSHLSALLNFALISSTNSQFILTFKNA